MVRAVALVLFLLLAGESVVASLGLPVPGAAPALAALVAHLARHGGPTVEMETLFDSVAPNAPLLVVLAAAGIIANLDLLALIWIPVVIVLGAQALLRVERGQA